MSTINNQTTSPSIDNFTAIFNVASAEYQTVTGNCLDTHPLATQFDTCQTPEAIANVLRVQAQAFIKFRKGNEKLMAWLDLIVHILFTFSTTLGDGIGLPFSPAKPIFTGIGVLLGAMRDVVASHDKTLRVFERIHFFLQRLNIYNGIPLTNELVELLGKVMGQLLCILALSTKAMTESRMKIFLKRLSGRTNVEDALEELDTLTKEEISMVVVRNLEVTHRVDGNTKVTEDAVQKIDRNINATKELTQVVDNSLEVIEKVIRDVDGNVKATNEVTHEVDGNVQEIKELTRDIGNNVKTMNEVVQGFASRINHRVKAMKNVTDEVERKRLQEKLRTWLSHPDPSINHNNACKIHHGGTATWFTQGSTFHEWKKNGSLLWLSGNPGSGKSIICSAIIEDVKNMREARPALIAYHYFDYKDPSKCNVHGLLGSLLFQLSDDSDRCQDVLYQLYKTSRDGAEQASDAALAECLKTILKHPEKLPILVIMDALDECPNVTGTPSAREEVLDLVDDLVRTRYSNLFLCITSRPEQDIQAVFKPLTSPSCCVSLHEEQGQREDIKNYICSFVHTDRAMRKWREEDKELVITTLSERAQGMFRWVFCQLDTLRRCIPSSIRKVLDELPTTLDDTYERALQGIPKQKSQHAFHLFQCLTAAIRPLRVEELAEMFAINFDADLGPNLMEGWRPENPEEAVLSTCSTLIAVIEDENGSRIVQFSHFSVKEFLTSDRLRTSDVGYIRFYHIPLDDAHTVLARACLTVLLQLDANVDKRRLAAFPLAFYAAQHWVDHAKFEDVALRIQDSMERLFDPRSPYLAAWVWIHNVEDWYQRSIEEHPSRPEATALYYAALCGFSRLANYLISTHAEDVNAMCSRHGTPLHAASYEGHINVVRLLLHHGAKVNVENKAMRTPLCSAFEGGHVEVVRLLLERGADANVQIPTTFSPPILVQASANGRIDIVHMLLQHNVNVNEPRDDLHWTALHNASFHGHLKVVKLLLEHGAEVNALDVQDGTPLRVASLSGHLDVVKILLEHGADVHMRAFDNLTAFQLATSSGQTKVAQLLLKRGAKLE